jgi:hypothetical protein
VSKRFLWVLLCPAVALTVVLLTAGGAVSGGQHVEKAGNCLSMPVIFGEGDIPLRGSPGYTLFEGDTAYSAIENIECWVQQDEDNIWQADWSPWGSENSNVSWVDWGDNLESQDWKTTSKVRVETVLFKDLVVKMTGYKMYYISGQGTSEVWGTDQTTYDSEQATVYSDHARLTIQLLNPEGGTLSWDPALGEWTGTGVSRTDFNGGCWEGVDGPGGYSAEVNVSGKAIYGFNWDVRNLSDATPGVYRITFSLDPDNGTGLLDTTLATAQILAPSEGEETAEALATVGGGGGKGSGSGGSTGGGGTAVIDPLNNLTYIDVTIKAGGGGRR